MPSLSDEWLYGWDDTPGVVSVWAEPDGHALVWRRDPATRELVREEAQFRPWLLLPSLIDLQHLGARLLPHDDAAPQASFSYEQLEGASGLRYVVRGPDVRQLRNAVLRGASQRLGRPISEARELGPDAFLLLPPEEQYLVATGRNYFRGLAFDDVRRLQFDLETTGLDPDVDRIFMVAVRGPSGEHEVLEAAGDDDAAEAQLLQRLAACIAAFDPDVIENHNLHGFDVPFL
ncbi:MAG TPA: ribonuclease H-like domain-containing protein, partial [Polyangiaceae bacterium]|nr:ribonuclease H-like domain-containing protein [Polyangiaceae bacterium]